MQLLARMHFFCDCVCVCEQCPCMCVSVCVCFCLKLRVLFVEWSSGAHSDRWCKLLIAVFPVAECGGPCPPSLSSFSFSCSFSLSLSLPFLSVFFFCGSGLSLKHQPHFSVQAAPHFSHLYLLFPLPHSLSTYLHLYPPAWAQTGIVQENKMCLFYPGWETKAGRISLTHWTHSILEVRWKHHQKRAFSHNNDILSFVKDKHSLCCCEMDPGQMQ